MGFEIKYSFHPIIQKGEYDRSSVQSGAITVGGVTEDVPLDALAGKVMALMARRNILVTEVEIFEYTKKKLNFKEAEDGIIIKNKKFKFDDGSATMLGEEVTGEESESEKLAELLKSNPQLLSMLQNQIKQPSSPVIQTPAEQKVEQKPVVQVQKRKAAIRSEIYNPMERFFVEENKKRGYAFTLGKKYPIFSEKFAGTAPELGMVYETNDDTGKSVKISDRCFTPDVQLADLGGGFGVKEEFVPSFAKQSLGNANASSPAGMPVLR